MDSTRSFLNRMNRPRTEMAVKYHFATRDKRVYARLENGQIVRRPDLVLSPTGKSAVRPVNQQ